MRKKRQLIALPPGASGKRNMERVIALGPLLERVYDSLHGYKKYRSEFRFQMLDWMNDLTELARVYHAPETIEYEEAYEIITGFLAHASGHVVRAARLAGLFSDPFKDYPDPDDRYGRYPDDRKRTQRRKKKA